MTTANKRINFTLATFLLVCATVSVVSGLVFRTPPPANLSIQLVGNNPNSECDTGIWLNFPDSHFHVVITNNSDRTVRLYQEWNSWGYHCLTFDLFDKNGKLIGGIEKAGPIQWTRNGPSPLKLRPYESHVIDVYWDEKWEMPIKPFQKNQGPSKYKIVTRYSNSACSESLRNNIWTGTLETEPLDVLLGYWPKKDNSVDLRMKNAQLRTTIRELEADIDNLKSGS